MTSRKPRVLFIALETFSRIGGLQQFNRRVIESLRRRDQETGGGHARALLLRDQTADIPEPIRGWVSGSGAGRATFALEAARAARASDVLLLGHVNLLPVGAFCKLFNPRLQIRLFVHGDEVWGDPVYRAPRAYDRPLLALVSRIASVSQFTAGRMQAAFGLPADRFLLFPNAVDERVFQPGQKAVPPTILTVSRLDKHDHGKNIDSLIRATGTLRDRGEHVSLEIIGDGYLRSQLVELSRDMGLTDRVIFRGRVPDADLSEAYGRATVFALPSSKEGFGIVYLEAWQRGLPVLCGTEDAAHEIVTDGVDGFAVHHKNIDLIADRLSFLVSHPDVASGMGQAGLEKVKANYMAANFHANLMDMLDG